MGRDEEAIDGLGRPNIAPLVVMATFEVQSGRPILRWRRTLRQRLGLAPILLVASEATRLLAISLLIRP